MRNSISGNERGQSSESIDRGLGRGRDAHRRLTHEADQNSLDCQTRQDAAGAPVRAEKVNVMESPSALISMITIADRRDSCSRIIGAESSEVTTVPHSSLQTSGSLPNLALISLPNSACQIHQSIRSRPENSLSSSSQSAFLLTICVQSLSFVPLHESTLFVRRCRRPRLRSSEKRERESFPQAWDRRQECESQHVVSGVFFSARSFVRPSNSGRFGHKTYSSSHLLIQEVHVE